MSMKDMQQRGIHKHSALMVISIFLVIFFIRINMLAATQPSTGSLIGQPAPEFVLNNLDGKAMSFSEFKGKVIILNFWATWCPPCRVEIPAFILLQKKYEKKGFTFIGVSLDENGPRIVKNFVKSAGMNYPQLMASYEVVMNYGNFEAIPTTFVIDRKGIVRNVLQGYHTQSMFENEIQKLLSEK